MNIFFYVVRYDSGFAPNPFFGYCTLATCKPQIRKYAMVGDWIVGCESADKKTQQGRRIVYVMEVTETLHFQKYFHNERFQYKKPNQRGSRKQARGDNIYSRCKNTWKQMNSYHSQKDGNPNKEHINRDTRVDRVLISSNYVYFGSRGCIIPNFLQVNGKSPCHKVRNYKKISTLKDDTMARTFLMWYKRLGEFGYLNKPSDWQ